jgi:hypothetical protein
VPPPCYRVCEFAAGVGGWASVIGGLNIACNNTNEQEDGDHDRRNDVFHDGGSGRRH